MFSKRTLELYSTLVLLSTCAVAQSSAVPAAKRGLFWKVSKGDQSVYLLGSVHLGSKGMYPLAKEIEQAFERSGTLVVEVDITKVDQQKAMALVMKDGRYAADDSLSKHLNPSTKAALEKFCADYGVPAAALETSKPWAVTLTVQVLPLMKSGADMNLGIDRYFLDRAHKPESGKRVAELESAEWQLKLLSGFPESVQLKYLDWALERRDQQKESFQRMADAWSRGDASSFDRIANEEFGGPEEVRKAMNDDRNPHMADVAEQMLKSNERAFVVVGAAHLVGKTGVVALLEKRGFTVEQVALEK